MNDRENPLIAAKVRRLLGVSPSEAIPDTITLEQVVVLHFGKSRRSDLSRHEKDDGQAIIDAINASGVAETRITETLEENHFRPIPLLSGHVDSPEYVTVIRKETFISNAALAEWWPSLGIEPGPMLAAWMEAVSQKETSQPAAPAKPAGPCVTKKELIAGLNLVGATWASRLSHPKTDGKMYLLARREPGRRGGKAGAQWNPVIFARLAVENKHLNRGQAMARFAKAWSQWLPDLEAEMGEIDP